MDSREPHFAFYKEGHFTVCELTMKAPSLCRPGPVYLIDMLVDLRRVIAFLEESASPGELESIKGRVKKVTA